ncbi:DNA polymerase II large subunit [Trichinella spiralis]|uniref:DNA polymerase II large subunit n=1 Tax=Trichinella spiralis TaxID=6334 RepID=A0ABR3KKI1_TRISP
MEHCDAGSRLVIVSSRLINATVDWDNRMGDTQATVNELVGVMKHYLVEPISSLTYVKGDLGYTSLNSFQPITAEEEIELRFHSRFLIGVALMISNLSCS